MEVFMTPRQELTMEISETRRRDRTLLGNDVTELEGYVKSNGSSADIIHALQEKYPGIGSIHLGLTMAEGGQWRGVIPKDSTKPT
jgi:hypothetical protein